VSELEKSLEASHARAGELETELARVTASAATARDAAASNATAADDAAASRAELQRERDSLRKEVAALESRVGRGEYNPDATKILHFRSNPMAIANESAAERELLVVRGECEALRETVAAFVAAQEQTRSDAAAHAAALAAAQGLTPPPGMPAFDGGGINGPPGTMPRYAMPPPFQTPGPPGPGPPPLMPPPSVAQTPAPAPAPGMGLFTGATPMTVARPPGFPTFAPTPGPSVAEADLIVTRRRVADLEKREQRYLAMFKQKISTFREACYLIFGYKVDMGEDKATGSTTFTLRSKFAANDEDALTFALEPGKVGATGGDVPGRVTLLPTPYSESAEVKLGVETFVTRFRSVPGFVANLTMELFNRQTTA
jgi:mitotic spindle assembly checkpoint protein MAD1